MFIRTCCATASPHICCSRAVTCERCRSLLGHASIRTTQIYTHLDFQHLAETTMRPTCAMAQADKP